MADNSSLIIGYVIPDISLTQAKDEVNLHPLPVFSSEKGDYNPSLVFPTVEEARKAIKKKYKL